MIKTKKIYHGILFPFLLFILWEGIIRISQFIGFKFTWFILIPPPSKILDLSFKLLLSNETISAISQTTSTCLLGFSVGMIMAIMSGSFVGSKMIIDSFISPTFHFLRSLPLVLYVPIALLFFGSGQKVPIFLAALITTLYGMLPVRSAIINYDTEKKYVLRSKGFSYFRILIFFVFPEIFGALSTTISITITLSLAVTIFSEMLITNLNGLGSFLITTKESSKYTEFWAYLIITGTLGYLLHFIIQKLWLFAVPWAKAKYFKEKK